MNTNLASYIMGMVIDENDHFYFVQKDGQTYALDKAEGPHQVGESVKGFAYTDMKQKLRLTTLEVTATQESFGWGTVTEVRKDLGVFVDTGLPDKQIVVSLDILPEIKDLWPKKGDRLYIRLEVDKKDRIWGILAYQEDFQRLARPAYNNMQNQNWPAIVYRLKLSGTFVYLPENNMLGFIHPSERYAEPRLGEVVNARVIGFREVDRTLNLSLKPRSFEMLENDAQMILTYLEANGGFMTLNDKSSPEEIKATFGISKGQFKKALGGLMKAKKINHRFGGRSPVLVLENALGYRAQRNRDHDVAGVLARGARPGAMLAVLGELVTLVFEVDERPVLLVALQDDAPALAAVTAVGTAESHEFLAAKMCRAAAAVPRAGEYLYVIYEIGTCHVIHCS